MIEKALQISLNPFWYQAGRCQLQEQNIAVRRKMLGLPDKKDPLYKGTHVFCYPDCLCVEGEDGIWESKGISNPLGSKEAPLLYPAKRWVTYNDKIGSFSSPAAAENRIKELVNTCPASPASQTSQSNGLEKEFVTKKSV